MAESYRLVADIGGTNARFALIEPLATDYSNESVLLCGDFISPEQAITHYLEAAGVTQLQAICFAVAGPVTDGSVELTNNNWHIRAAALQSAFCVSEVKLLNDFEAIAYSLSVLKPADLKVIGLPPAPDLAVARFTVGVVGPGTGLGAAALLKREERLYSLITEGGHVGFAPENGLQRAVWEVLVGRFGRVSDERLLSGSGLENIYTALSEIHDIPAHLVSAAEIFAQSDDNFLASETVSLFFEALGQVAGNFALSTGAFDGIYIAGGIANRYPNLLASSAFRSGFENKGRHRHIMEGIPTLLITHPQPGLLGASVVARDLG